MQYDSECYVALLHLARFAMLGLKSDAGPLALAAHRPRQAMTTHPTAKLEIVIVDDDPEIRDSLTVLFESGGYSVRTFDSALLAMRLIEKSRPDAVVTNICTLGGDGIELIRSVRRLSRLTPIIAMLAPRVDKFDALHMAQQLGANAVHHKGNDAARLLELVNTCLGR